jgi:hypothetical protein
MNEPAFPGVTYITLNGEKNPEGMTLRDYFAAKAMQAFESRHDLDDIAAFKKANRCYQIADAMLKAREK